MPIDEVYEKAQAAGIDRKDAEKLTQEMKRKGDLYEPKFGYLSMEHLDTRPARKAADRTEGEAGYCRDQWPAGQ